MMGKVRLISITSYFSPHAGEAMKARLRRLRQVDHRLTESRVGEDALNLYVSMLEAKMLPTHSTPASRRKTAVGE